MRLRTGCPGQSRSGCGRSNFCGGPSMATPALARDFKEFLKLLNSNHVEYLLIGGYAVGIYGHQKLQVIQPPGCPRARCPLLPIRPAPLFQACKYDSIKRENPCSI